MWLSGDKLGCCLEERKCFSSLRHKGNLKSSVQVVNSSEGGSGRFGGSRVIGGRLVVGGLGFVSILPQAASVLCCFVSVAIKRSCSYFSFASILESFWGLISKEERGGYHSQKTWFVGFVLGPCPSVKQSKAK